MDQHVLVTAPDELDEARRSFKLKYDATIAEVFIAQIRTYEGVKPGYIEAVMRKGPPYGPEDVQKIAKYIRIMRRSFGVNVHVATLLERLEG